MPICGAGSSTVNYLCWQKWLPKIKIEKEKLQLIQGNHRAAFSVPFCTVIFGRGNRAAVSPILGLSGSLHEGQAGKAWEPSDEPIFFWTWWNNGHARTFTTASSLKV